MALPEFRSWRVSGAAGGNAYRLLAYESHCEAAYAGKYKAAIDVFEFVFSGDSPAVRSTYRRIVEPRQRDATSDALQVSQAGSSAASPNSPPSTRRFTAPETVAYGIADEEIGGPARAPESGTPA